MRKPSADPFIDRWQFLRQVATGWVPLPSDVADGLALDHGGSPRQEDQGLVVPLDHAIPWLGRITLQNRAGDKAGIIHTGETALLTTPRTQGPLTFLLD